MVNKHRIASTKFSFVPRRAKSAQTLELIQFPSEGRGRVSNPKAFAGQPAVSTDLARDFPATQQSAEKTL
jgi:hypothetical protein